MAYDALIIGAGLSGLTTAALLAKRGLKVCVLEKGPGPGGSCGAFKRAGALLDQGAAMLYGFGEKGFNAHRFAFNCLEERIDVLRHDLLYAVNFEGRRIRFFPDLGEFSQELAAAFPGEAEGIRRFYRDMDRVYRHVLVDSPSYTTPDETDRMGALRGMARHPVSYARFLSYLNRSAEGLLKQYFKGPDIFRFFDKMTSTYCYATVREAPAILAAVMFVDNHEGGSWYPAGSTLFVPGRLEKSVEEHGGVMRYGEEAGRILFRGGRAAGAVTASGEEIEARDVVYSGNVWDLYGRLVPETVSSGKRRAWAASLAPTYASVVLYAVVDEAAIPEGTAAVEMLAGNPQRTDESEVTVYVMSVDDKTICPPGAHAVMAIGPSLLDWPERGTPEYDAMKEREKARLLGVLEGRFPGFSAHVRHAEVATPRTLERYLNKFHGSVAGPKQMLGQHMFKRLHTRTEFPGLYCCGESTVMGTGTPTVTTSGIAAANAVLRARGLEPFRYKPDMRNYVRVLPAPVLPGQAYADLEPGVRALMRLAGDCLLCEDAPCTRKGGPDVRGAMRRAMVGNAFGARRALGGAGPDALEACEKRCRLNRTAGRPVPVREISALLDTLEA